MVAIAAVGLAVSAYLTWLHYSGSLALCLGVGGCEAVQTSRYSMIGPVPVALLGLIGYLFLFGATVVRLRLAGRTPHDVRVLIFGASLAATLFTGYLTYLELFIIEAVCPWCVVIAVCSVLLLVLSSIDLAIRAVSTPR